MKANQLNREQWLESMLDYACCHGASDEMIEMIYNSYEATPLYPSENMCNGIYNMIRRDSVRDCLDEPANLCTAEKSWHERPIDRFVERYAYQFAETIFNNPRLTILDIYQKLVIPKCIADDVINMLYYGALSKYQPLLWKYGFDSYIPYITKVGVNLYLKANPQLLRYCKAFYKIQRTLNRVNNKCDKLIRSMRKEADTFKRDVEKIINENREYPMLNDTTEQSWAEGLTDLFRDMVAYKLPACSFFSYYTSTAALGPTYICRRFAEGEAEFVHHLLSSKTKHLRITINAIANRRDSSYFINEMIIYFEIIQQYYRSRGEQFDIWLNDNDEKVLVTNLLDFMSLDDFSNHQIIVKFSKAIPFPITNTGLKRAKRENVTIEGDIKRYYYDYRNYNVQKTTLMSMIDPDFHLT